MAALRSPNIFARDCPATPLRMQAAFNATATRRVTNCVKTGQFRKSRSQHKVLLVEDEPILACATSDVIASLGFDVETAQNSDDALDILNTDANFDLVITDIIISSKLNGFHLAKVIRERLPDVPLIYMSGYTGYTQEDMGDTVAQMLHKPCQPDELSFAIHKAIGISMH